MNIHSVNSKTAATIAPAAPDADKRDAILDAALELFAERTFDGTPVPMIAARAGVGAGTIYRYFDDKTALVNGLYQRWKATMRDYIVPSTPPGDAREEFHLWWDGLWRFASEHPAAFAFLETQHHQAYLDDRSRALAGEITVAAIGFTRRAQAAGAIRKAKPEMLIALVLGAFTGLVKSAGEGGMTYSKKDALASEECAWSMLRA